MPSYRDAWRSPGLWIRDYLAQHGVATTSEMHRALRDRITRENAMRPKALRFRAPTFPSFRRYATLLETLGALGRVGEADVDPRYQHLRGVDGGEQMQVLYQATAPSNDAVWYAPWRMAQRRAGPRAA